MAFSNAPSSRRCQTSGYDAPPQQNATLYNPVAAPLSRCAAVPTAADQDALRCYCALCSPPEPTSLHHHETANGLCPAGFGLGIAGCFGLISRARLASRDHARRGRLGLEFGTSRSIGDV